MQFRLTRCYDERFVQDIIGFNSCNARRDLRLGIIKEIKKSRWQKNDRLLSSK